MRPCFSLQTVCLAGIVIRTNIFGCAWLANAFLSVCLDSLAKSGDRVWTVLRAEALTNKMKELHKSGNANTKPNMITYRSLLKCYANWNLVQDAERLLQRMQVLYDTGKVEYGPDKVSFQVVIDAILKSDEDDAVERAENLKKQAEQIYGKGKGWQQDTLIGADQVDAILEYMNE